MDLDINSFGAVGDGVTMNTAVIQNAIDRCAMSGGRVTVSGGRFKTGTIVMKSNVELHLAADGVLLGSDDCSDYPERKDLKHVDQARLPRWRSACLIYADECENISLTGPGTIDCSGDKFVLPIPAGRELRGWAYSRIDAPTPPRAVFFTGCRNVRVEQVTMTNQPAGWSYWIHDCDYVTFDKVKILADVNYPNNDGIHINCSRNVSVSNSFITCGDDAIIVRANSVSLKENKVCERVTITNCSLTSWSSGIRIGWINDGIIRNCTFSNIVMTDCTVGVGIYLPYTDPNQPGTGPSDIGREDTLVENLSFSNIIMDRVCSTPVNIYIDDNPSVRCRGIRNIWFTGLHARGPELPSLKGRADCRLKNIQFIDCSFEQTDGSEFEDRTLHGACVHFDGKHHPMVTRHIDGLRMQNTDFSVL